MAKKREARETKEIGIKRLVENFEKNNRTVCPPEKKREFEKMYTRDILPKVYEDRK